ncbi:LolA family protein [Glaciibacter psychrotolerans]|uniref:Outer membrane lipoprotein-sorting protein n=1 Tax=Glaciibacter psychrotolerans TaxID=670054 RepID=A0A7Z0ECP4_9MICO|nr:DUF2092 domain-containing protein [Leifsonia psychrotolerans]NYJ18745.1 outer membrane lipoprotein-sorting protein [Leifsonia psychrotolerans]
MTRVWLHWMPAIVVPAVIAAGVLVVPMMATAASDLPGQTPAQVLELIGSSSVTALSGTVQQTSDLGIPDLPIGAASAGPDATSMLDLLTGSHTARVYLDGSDKTRVQVLDSLAERDVVRNGSDLWYYNTADQTATHVTVPASMPGGDVASPVPTTIQTPAQVAQKFLAAIDPSTSVALGPDTTVAGRAAYTLVLTPKAGDTLVGSVSIAVDGTTGLPLSVDVHAVGQSAPAFEIAFTDLSLAAPSASLFTFTPPAGVTVKEQSLPTMNAMPTPDATAVPHTVIGSGWSAVLELPPGTVPASLTSSPLYPELTQAVTGGRVFSTSLANVLLTTDGRVFAGAVSTARLQAAAAQ